jgi:hypothetical protein
VASTFDCRVNGEPMFMVLRRNKACSLCHWFVVLNLVGDTTCKWIYISVCLPWTQKIVLFQTSHGYGFYCSFMLIVRVNTLWFLVLAVVYYLVM